MKCLGVKNSAVMQMQFPFIPLRIPNPPTNRQSKAASTTLRISDYCSRVSCRAKTWFVESSATPSLDRAYNIHFESKRHPIPSVIPSNLLHDEVAETETKSHDANVQNTVSRVGGIASLGSNWGAGGGRCASLLRGV